MSNRLLHATQFITSGSVRPNLVSVPFRPKFSAEYSAEPNQQKSAETEPSVIRPKTAFSAEIDIFGRMLGHI